MARPPEQLPVVLQVGHTTTSCPTLTQISRATRVHRYCTISRSDLTAIICYATHAQVLLSQSHRLRALMLLQRFLDLGAWAVNLALSVGIFPYVLKLLQAPTHELRSVQHCSYLS